MKKALAKANAFFLAETARFELASVEEQANALFLRLVKDYASSKGVTEQLKAEEPMEWVRRMNGIKARVTDKVNVQVIVV